MHPYLGTLYVIPREIRDRIYSLVLNLDSEEDRKNPSPTPSCRTAILLASKCIYEEARIALFQTNEFCFWIDHDESENTVNCSVMGDDGFTLKAGRCDEFGQRQKHYFATIPYDMIPKMRFVYLKIGVYRALEEYDIVGYVQDMDEPPVYGPERSTYLPIMKAVNDVCTLLKSCHQLRQLQLQIRSCEHIPGSIEDVIDPIRKLRGIKHCSPIVLGMQDDKWVDWKMKESYARYMEMIMALPGGVEAPEYVGDEKPEDEKSGDEKSGDEKSGDEKSGDEKSGDEESADKNATDEKVENKKLLDQSKDSLFELVGGRWLGGNTFQYPSDYLIHDSEEKYSDDVEQDWYAQDIEEMGTDLWGMDEHSDLEEKIALCFA